MKADVELRVGKREGGGLPLVYTMDAKWLALDSATKENGDSFIRYPAGQANTHSVSENATKIIMDASSGIVNAADDDDGLNIRILAIWDKDGNSLPELEDKPSFMASRFIDDDG